MWERRIFYLVVLLGSLVFYFVYQQWLAWALLLTVIFLPWLSLGLSLPAMLSAQVTLRCPGITRVGVPTRVTCDIHCKFPAPPVAGKIRLVNHLTGERYVGSFGEHVPTEHCGKVTVSMVRAVVYDYLGLFSRRLPAQVSCAVVVLPKPVPAELPRLGSRNDSNWKPKPGGGLAENHELRLFRPGDELRNVHWKMSAKTGKLIYREAMEQAKQGHVLALRLSGSPEVLDRKLGQLLWTSRQLLTQKLPHQVRCFTGKGLARFSVTGEDSLEEGLRSLLNGPCVTGGDIPDTEGAFWQHRIGGDSDEE